jgi:fructokinase
MPRSPGHAANSVRYRLPVQEHDPPTFVVIGEALIDLATPGTDGSAVARPGGSPMNVAVGLARLGEPTAFAGRVSTDPFGAIIRQHLERSGVDLQHVVTAVERSTIALVRLAGGHATYEYALGADFNWSADELAFLPGGALAVHFGSLASWLPPGSAAIAAAIGRLRRSGSVLISYDPNVRPALQPDAVSARQQIEQSVSLAHLVRASLDDVHWLYGPGADVDAVAGMWLARGAGIVVITMGAYGATAWVSGQAPVSRPGFPTAVTDTVGAGDAFTSGLLDALSRRELLAPGSLTALGDAANLAGILDEASRIAAITCSRPGADPPSRAEAESWPAAF